MNGVDERRPLDFHTPYGCSKGAADQYVLDYARSFDLPTCVLRMSCIYGPRQMGTEDQGWVAHFLIRALAGQPITIYGDGRQVRDILFVDDAVEAYVSAWRRIQSVKRPGVQPRRRTAPTPSACGFCSDISRPCWVARSETRFEDWRPATSATTSPMRQRVRRPCLGRPGRLARRRRPPRCLAASRRRRAAAAVRRVEAVS
jgi:CDP-paratose 2-epimerase